jgi:pantothenate synthetase
VLSRALQVAHEAWRAGETRPAALEARMRNELGKEAAVTAEYIAVVEPEGFRAVQVADARSIVAIAARVGSTRLIDNIVLAEGIG